MLTYIVRRLLLVPFLLFGVTLLIFGMLQFLDPVERASLYIRGDPKANQIEAAITKYCLDCPIHIQYFNWMVGKVDARTGEREGGILFGNFGWSKTGSQPVADLIARRFPEHPGFNDLGGGACYFGGHLAGGAGCCSS
jgi:peptide/nickel transport system permease protein